MWGVDALYKNLDRVRILGCTPPKCGVGLRRWENQRRLSGDYYVNFIITASLGEMMSTCFTASSSEVSTTMTIVSPSHVQVVLACSTVQTWRGLTKALASLQITYMYTRAHLFIYLFAQRSSSEIWPPVTGGRSSVVSAAESADSWAHYEYSYTYFHVHV